MYLTLKDKLYIQQTISFLLENEEVLSMQQYIQHGNISTYDHCLNVAYMSFYLIKQLHLHVNVKEMLVGAMLHDFFLYDWHDGRVRREGLHCFTHPKIALQNAIKTFSLTQKEKNIIDSHMFPATLLHCPRSKEAIIVSLADKICAAKETLSAKRISYHPIIVEKNPPLQ